MPRSHAIKDYRNFGIMAHIDAGKTAKLSKKPRGIEELLPCTLVALDWSLEVSLPRDLQPESTKSPKTDNIYTF